MILSMAHRGASGYAPENTLLAFKKAIELDSDIIELDVQVTKDKEVVVCHDQKVWSKFRYISITHNTLEKIKQVKLAKSQYIPTLGEALNIINRKAKVNIEIKDKGCAKYINKIILEYIKRKRWGYNDFIVSSFIKEELQTIKRLNSKIKIGLLYKRLLGNTEKDIEHYKPYSVNVHFTAVKKNFVKKMHEKRIKVFVWTVNTRKLIDKLRGYNVDGICSDYPDRI